MKYIASFILAGSGYLAVEYEAHKIFISQPVWLMITEGVLAHLVCGIPAFLFVATDYVRNHSQARPDGSDILMGVFVGLLWPLFGIGYAVGRGWQSFKTGSINDAIAAYGIKRRKTVDKNS